MSGNYNDWFVATVAFLIAVGAGVVSASSWETPYQLRSVKAIVDRYGMSAGRAFWVVIAITSLASGAMIASGIRPGYAQPKKSDMEIAR
ncbi:MAG: hypothetical protein AAFV88_13500 [Planctomycetota bacterium]